jgi:hypothetical protein
LGAYRSPARLGEAGKLMRRLDGVDRYRRQALGWLLASGPCLTAGSGVRRRGGFAAALLAAALAQHGGGVKCEREGR